MRHSTLEHRFIRNAPRELEPGVLYISMEYATAVHLCCCGCGERVVTPFTPTDWQMTFDGESVTLSPSVGNWNQDCRSHYLIEENRIIECGRWSDARIDEEVRRDKQAKSEHFNRPATGVNTDIAPTEFASSAKYAGDLWSRFRRWIS